MAYPNWKDGCEDPSGQINQDVYPQTGTVDFGPCGKTWEFYYYPDEATIYWGGHKGSTNNIWVGVIQPGKRIVTYMLLEVKFLFFMAYN